VACDHQLYVCKDNINVKPPPSPWQLPPGPILAFSQGAQLEKSVAIIHITGLISRCKQGFRQTTGWIYQGEIPPLPPWVYHGGWPSMFTSFVVFTFIMLMFPPFELQVSECHQMPWVQVSTSSSTKQSHGHSNPALNQASWAPSPSLGTAF